jgi:hypothetical protein
MSGANSRKNTTSRRARHLRALGNSVVLGTALSMYLALHMIPTVAVIIVVVLAVVVLAVVAVVLPAVVVAVFG